MTFDVYEVGLAAGGFAALLAAWVPAYTKRRPLSLPLILVAIGAAFFLLPLGLPAPDPDRHLEIIERTTEFVVIVALMGAGLKIDRPLGWRTWASTWRMLGIAMPATIALTAVLGASVGGLTFASALLLGAVVAPTDPVLATDVQVGEPTTGSELAEAAEDDVRFTLTSEGGLNDALAFPFVYLAIATLEQDGPASTWLLTWIALDLVGRIAIALVVGWAVGRLIGTIAFRPPGRLSALARTPQGFVVIAATLMAYGTTELLQGYGFLAVFVSAVVLRRTEPAHELHGELHGFAEQTENLLVVGLLFLFGGSLASGTIADLSWTGAVVAVAVVLAVRPLSGALALARSSLGWRERSVIAFFGIRGVGSFYYLAYGLSAATFEGSRELWTIVSLVVVLSIAVHGVGATPVMARLDRGGGPSGTAGARVEPGAASFPAGDAG